jgi:hypothetical protein
MVAIIRGTRALGGSKGKQSRKTETLPVGALSFERESTMAGYTLSEENAWLKGYASGHAAGVKVDAQHWHVARVEELQNALTKIAVGLISRERMMAVAKEALEIRR